MWIDHRFFPFEISRHIRQFVYAFTDDYDLRFQETRNRRLRMISIDHPDTELSQALANEWKAAGERVSFLDWGQLFEWSEEYRRLHLRDLIHTSLRKLLQEDLSESQRAILNRLRDIDSEIKSIPLPEKASWFEMVKIRWSVPSLVDEVEYLVARLKSMQI